MANWHYYNKNGEKVGPISVAALRALVERGLITRETVIENHTGRTAVAGEVRGLTFPETEATLEPETPPEPVSPDDIEPASISPPVESETIAMQFGNVPIHSIEAPPQSEVYGLSAPESKKEPTVETVPPAADNPFTTSGPVEENPFTAAMPDVEKPPVSDNPFADTSASANPFTAPEPETKRSAPGVVSAVKISASQKKSVLHNGNKKVFVIVGIAAVIVVIFGFGAVDAYQKWQRNEDRRLNREIFEQNSQTNQRIQEGQRESQKRMARIRANAEIDRMRQEHDLIIIRNQYSMTSSELSGLRRKLDMELESFKSRKEMEILMMDVGK